MRHFGMVAMAERKMKVLKRKLIEKDGIWKIWMVDRKNLQKSCQ
jgi:hypothetical protein